MTEKEILVNLINNNKEALISIEEMRSQGITKKYLEFLSNKKITGKYLSIFWNKKSERDVDIMSFQINKIMRANFSSNYIKKKLIEDTEDIGIDNFFK